MIGDYVRISFRKAKVVEIRKDTVGVEFLDDNGFDVFKPSDILPIELTKEILLLNPGEMRKLKNENFDIIFDDYGEASLIKRVDDSEHGYHDFEFIYEVRYVHSFQHTLRQFGIDNDIVFRKEG